MEIEDQRLKLPPRETLSRHGPGLGLIFGVPMVAMGGLLLALAFGPSELRQELGNPPLWLVAPPGVLVTGIGVMFLGAGSRERARRRRIDRMKETQALTPWAWDYPWKPEGVRSAVRRWLGKTLAFVILGALCMTPINGWVFQAGGPWLGRFVAVVFDLLLAVAVLTIGLMLVGLWKYGDPWLRFSYFPFRLGQELNVQLDRPRALATGSDLRCTVRCIEEQIEIRTKRVAERGQWKNEQRSEIVCYQRWAATESVSIEGHAPHLDIRFPLPADDRLATRLMASPAQYWELEVRCDAPGLDYYATFLLPVYA